jgi:hypothetical protein
MTLPHHATNRAAFDKILPDLMKEHAGEFAVMDNGELQGVFKSAGDAMSRFGRSIPVSVSIMRVSGPARLGAQTPGGAG